jgi:hypothetical protein
MPYGTSAPGHSQFTTMAILIAATVVILASGGCTTTLHASLPEVARQEPAANSPTVGLANVKDARASNEIGNLGVGGAITMTSGSELPDYIFDLAASQLAAEGFDAVISPDPADPAHQANRFKGNTILFTLQSVDVTMTDTLVTPGRSSAAIRAQIFDAQGKEIYSNQVSGSYSESFPLISGPETISKMTGKIAAAACNRAVLTLILDSKFLAALRGTPQKSAANQTVSR